MPASEGSRASARTSTGAVRRWTLALIGLLAVAVAVAVAFAVAGWGEPVELDDGIGAEQVGEDVAGSDLVVVGTFQGVGFFVDTDAGQAFVYYGDATDRFGVGTTIAELEGEVAAITDELLDELRGQVRPEQLDQLAGQDVFVRADEIEVVLPPAPG